MLELIRDLVQVLRRGGDLNVHFLFWVVDEFISKVLLPVWSYPDMESNQEQRNQVVHT